MRITASLDGPVARQKTLPDLGVQPRALEVDALLLLDREVAVVRLAQLLAGDADEPAVDVHELAPCARGLLTDCAASAARAPILARPAACRHR